MESTGTTSRTRPVSRTAVYRLDPEAPDATLISAAGEQIRRGGLVAFPTETVYGLGANARDPLAVARIFAAKGRPSTDPLIVHIGERKQLPSVASDVPAQARPLTERFWPGPLTLLLPRHPDLPLAVTAGLPVVGVRVPQHPVARALLAAAGVPIAAPSANRFSRPSPTRASHVLADLDGVIDLVLDAGTTPVGIESTVLDLTCTPPRVLRPGGITLEALAQVIPGVQLVSQYEAGRTAAVAPGQMLRHYAPQAPLTLFEGALERVVARVRDEVRARAANDSRVGVLAPADVLAPLDREWSTAERGRIVAVPFGTRHDPGRAAHELFDALRAFDAANVASIVAVGVEAHGLGAAIRDRLVRAAEGKVVTLGEEV